MSEKGFEPQGYKRADMKMQTHNTDTEEVFAIYTETDDTDTEEIIAINTQTDDSRKKDVLVHSKDLDVHSCSSDSSSLADFDDEEIPTEISDAISR